MVFNSNSFLIFFAVFLVLYYISRRSLTGRNLLIIAASYLFYAWWDYRFVALLAFSSVFDYAIGWAIGRSHSSARRRLLLIASLVVNLSILGFFKYFDFFRESLEALLASLGWSGRWRGLNVVLPVGISFYTFQSISYVVDVYRRQIEPSKSLIQFLAYVCFFPQLVAGPIERAAHLLPQFVRTAEINVTRVQEGVWLILWGMFKKVVLADNFAPLVDLVFQHLKEPAGVAILLGSIAFAFQIYCDFSGYSDIARGAAKLLGFELMLNFNIPYFAANLREFWQRWHISLSTWLRDYVYIPLGGNRKSPERTYLNLMGTMLLGGLWHGAAPTFVLWGLWHGMGLAIHRWWAKRNRPLAASVSWLITILFVLYGWMLFRATSLYQIVQFTKALGDRSMPAWTSYYIGNLIVLSAPLLLLQVWQQRSGNLLAPLTLPLWARSLLQGGLLYAVALFWSREASPFIYFQF